MVSIKDKIAKMIKIANGELVRHCHAVEAGILGEDNEFYLRVERAKGNSKSKKV
jgi:hypothetical protein